MWNLKPIVLGLFFSIVISFGPLVMTVLAGNLDSPAAPSDPGSAMYTLEDIYNRLNAGTAGSKRTGGFREPTSGPGSTGRTLDEVMGKAPSVDDTNGAGVADVLADKTFWGLTSGAWGSKTGTRYGGCTCSGTMNGTRWCDNGDGTVTDLTTCLVWLQKADWGGPKPWRNSETDCNPPTYTCYDDAHTRAGILNAETADANLDDGSVEGDWRLPTKTELEGLVNGTEAVSSGNMRAFTDVQAYLYWSSSTDAGYIPRLGREHVQWLRGHLL